jgi:hypothetical protein
MWINSMTIPLDQLSGAAHPGADAPLDVQVLLNIGKTCTVEDTLCLLSIQISSNCKKVFEFGPGAQVKIPVSDKRPTSVTVTCRDGNTTLPVQSVLVDLRNKTNTTPDRIVLTPSLTSSDLMLYSTLNSRNETLAFKFPCFRYERDAIFDSKEYSIQSLQEDCARLQENPVIVPSRPATLVSTNDAVRHIIQLENSLQQVQSVLNDCCLHTAMVELGSSADTARDVAASVNWNNSYCVPQDNAVSEVINLTRDIYHKVGAVSKMAVAVESVSAGAGAGAGAEAGAEAGAGAGAAGNLSREVSQTVQGLLRKRAELAAVVQGRRQDLDSVIPVRTSFLVMQAIDDALRSAFRVRKTFRGRKPATSSESSFAADGVACFDYWLGQMKSNTHNSVTMSDDTYDAARVVLATCKRVKDSGVTLAPLIDVTLSSLGCKVWENMLLQGITSEHPLIAASVPYMLYKKQTVLDFDKHPIVQVLAEKQCSAEQVQSAKLLAILVSHDVEHRIITPALEDSIIRNFALAITDKGSNIEAEKFLLNVFETSLQSLVMSALGRAPCPDLTFLTEAARMPSTTGYNMETVSSIYLDAVLKLK